MSYRAMLVFGSVLWAACGRPNVLPSLALEPGVLLVVLDGVGLAPPGPGNAVAAAMAAYPEGFLARALANHDGPLVQLGASGRCVGLSEGTDGNSEAGHNNLCAASIVEQLPTRMARLREQESLAHELGLQEVFAQVRKAERPLHLLAALADRSSAGNYLDAVAVARAAVAAGVPRVYVHGVCNGRSGQSCLAMAQAIEAAAPGVQMATVAGTESCYSRLGASEGVARCVEAMRAPREPGLPSVDAVLGPLAADGVGQSQLQPVALRGSQPLGAADNLLVLQYRRDIAHGLVRLLRKRPSIEAPVVDAGPTVTTLGSLDAAAFYDSDPHLRLMLRPEKSGGFLHQRLAAAGITELRIAEADKAAHVTYFCDDSDVPDSAQYQRFHPPALTTSLTATPCLNTPASSARAQAAMRAHEARFIMVNLPNADLLGHTGDVAATVAGIACMDAELQKLADVALAQGYGMIVTADHGNAEAMGSGGSQAMSHTTAPVPFVLLAPAGARAQLRPQSAAACLHRVSWTVLDLLGIADAQAASLREP